MINNDLFNKDSIKQSEKQSSVATDNQVLDEIIEFILNPQTQPEKIMATLDIIHDSKSIIMNLLEEQQFEAVSKLISAPQIILRNQKVLIHKDSSGRSILNYFIDYAPQQIVNQFIKLCKDNHDNISVKSLIENRLNKKNYLMLVANREDSSAIFKELADLVTLSLGIGSLHQMLNEADYEGNNCLMLAFRTRNLHVIEQVFDILDQTIKNGEDKQKIENAIFSQVDSHGNNILMLLANTNDTSLQPTYELIIERLDKIAITPLLQRNVDKNDVLMLALINDNELLINKSFKLLEALPENQMAISLQRVISGFNSSKDNFITISFSKGKIETYLTFIKVMENHLEQKLIVGVFKRIFELHNDFLGKVFTSNNIDAIMSVMKYIQLANDSIGQEKEYVSELILKKDDDNNSLLLTSIKSQNFEVCKLILDIAKDSCNKIDLIRLISTRDEDKMTCYMLAKANNNENMINLIKDFAEKTNNKKYIELQESELKSMLIVRQSHHSFIIRDMRV